jgi:hypothetical protein
MTVTQETLGVSIKDYLEMSTDEIVDWRNDDHR